MGRNDNREEEEEVVGESMGEGEGEQGQAIGPLCQRYLHPLSTALSALPSASL